jgi:putative oxidoreductase
MNNSTASTLPNIGIISAAPQSKSSNRWLWVGQIMLALVFAMSGGMKLFGTLPAQNVISPTLITFIGTMELLGALGLILPRLLNIMPILTAWAATGLATIMLLAIALHVSRGEFSEVAVTVILGSIAVLVARGRFKSVANA